ncbi:hypothetical protein BBF96_10675 [Anoxybacter fermentans]|uniref:Hydrolase n=1 Tax=Anoxybacter fermentans TaxID=1323375 RepID=A0A3S9SZR9_9FIRM|nr:HAD family hydrolase [Anoxybacter fermentans]AZR73808.1 hypothetical protein BBF96_10675 [Anoxybacter fermentans]
MKITTILFDLDGTLLPMDLDIFIDRYFKALTRRFAAIIKPEQFIKDLYASTMEMIKNNDPEKTNQEVFIEDFFKRVPLKFEEAMPEFDAFYEKDFPKLKDEINLKLEGWKAKELMDVIFDAGYQVVIATNPIFPEAAVKERLRWVGLADYPYKLITSYEIMHFCKPNPNYFKEICEKIGVDPRECLMVGNDMEEDLPASLLGMKTFIVEDFLIDRGTGRFTPDGRGSLMDLYHEIMEKNLIYRK